MKIIKAILSALLIINTVSVLHRATATSPQRYTDVVNKGIKSVPNKLVGTLKGAVNYFVDKIGEYKYKYEQ